MREGELRADLRRRSLPALLCDVDAFDRNARLFASKANGKPVRVASKSLRSRAFIERVLRVDGFRGVLAYDAREAAWLAGTGIRDIIVAYPTVDARALAEVAFACAGGAQISVMVDDAAHVEAAARAAEEAKTRIGIVIDADASTSFPGIWFGVRRSPLRTPRAVVVLARATTQSGRTPFRGLMMYEAQIAGLTDARLGQRAMSAVIRSLKARSRADIAQRRAAIVDALRADGFADFLVNGGGTGSIDSTSAEAAVTEVTVGSGLFASHLFDGYRSAQPSPSLFFALEVARRPHADIVTCRGGGIIASGEPAPDRLPRPFAPPGLELLPNEGAGEVQTPLTGPGTAGLAIGDAVLFRPAKAGETCERFSEILLVERDRVTTSVPTYRGEGKNFG